MSKYRMHLLVCGGTGCVSSESGRLAANLERLVRDQGLAEEVQIVKTGCFGFCEKGPIVKVHPENVFYVEVKPSDADEIVSEHVVKGRAVERLLYVEPNRQERIAESRDMPFYRKQLRIALRNCGLIDPENIDEYIAADGYQALGRALTELSPLDVIETIRQSGLRGRGGGGFNTGLKWRFARGYESPRKYVICNADEGDPGAFMDRSILEGDPHSVLEAMAIAGYAIGADRGYVYIRAEYPLAVSRLVTAIGQAREYGLLGRDILGTGFDFDIEIRYGAGAFVCGEETALINSIQGDRGEPYTKPPFPAEKGLWKRPTIVNNVETLANVPVILLRGADWFARIGTESSRGTKVFALAGKVKNVGLVEVPMGTTLREIIFDIGGGIQNDRAFKAVQTGGPSGGCIPASLLDTPIDYENLTRVGSMMGSGGMIVMDETDCMVNIARFYLEFTMDEACGKCTACRVGNKRLYEILTRISDGKGTLGDIDELAELGQIIKDTALCGLGQTSPNPVLSTITHFLDEYRAHVVDRRCPAGVCKSLVRFNIIEERCVGCTACARVCPVACIAGAVKKPHVIDQSRCIKCGLCHTTCRFSAIDKI